MLRTGIKPPQSVSSVPFARQSMSLAGHSEKVNEKGGDEGVKPRLPRRSEITPLKSLGTPCIVSLETLIPLHRFLTVVGRHQD